MGLEELTLENNLELSDSMQNLHSPNDEQLSQSMARHVFEQTAFKNLHGKLKDSKIRKELEELVMKYSAGMVVDSNYFKKAHSRYHIGKLGKILGAGTAASGLMYSLPGRFYPSVNGIGDALQYLNPFSGKSIGGDIAKYTVLRGLKGIGSTLFSPFMYLSAGYTLYKVIKGLIQRKKNKNERSKLVSSLSDEELYQTLQQLKERKGVVGYLPVEADYQKFREENFEKKFPEGNKKNCSFEDSFEKSFVKQKNFRRTAA